MNANTQGTQYSLIQGQIQDFKIEGAQKMSSAHYEREARNPFNSAGFHIGPAYMHWRLLGISCCLMLSETCFEAFWYKIE